MNFSFYEMYQNLADRGLEQGGDCVSMAKRRSVYHKPQAVAQSACHKWKDVLAMADVANACHARIMLTEGSERGSVAMQRQRVEALAALDLQSETFAMV